jgi:hypothetical protein
VRSSRSTCPPQEPDPGGIGREEGVAVGRDSGGKERGTGDGARLMLSAREARCSCLRGRRGDPAGTRVACSVASSRQVSLWSRSSRSSGLAQAVLDVEAVEDRGAHDLVPGRQGVPGLVGLDRETFGRVRNPVAEAHVRTSAVVVPGVLQEHLIPSPATARRVCRRPRRDTKHEATASMVANTTRGQGQAQAPAVLQHRPEDNRAGRGLWMDRAGPRSGFGKTASDQPVNGPG